MEVTLFWVFRDFSPETVVSMRLVRIGTEVPIHPKHI